MATNEAKGCLCLTTVVLLGVAAVMFDKDGVALILILVALLAFAAMLAIASKDT